MHALLSVLLMTLRHYIHLHATRAATLYGAISFFMIIITFMIFTFLLSIGGVTVIMDTSL